MKIDRGFTLVELLIALMIFSIISVAALSSVNHMIRAREQQVKYHDINQQLGKAYGLIFQDMMWFIGDISVDQQNVQFTCTQASDENSVITLGYQLKEGKLLRAGVLLLDKVSDIRMSWLTQDKQWVGVFDQEHLKDQPLLFRMQFIAPHLGEVTWVFATPHL